MQQQKGKGDIWIEMFTIGYGSQKLIEYENVA